MGRLFLTELDDDIDQDIYVCRSCETHICYTSTLVQENYTPVQSGLTGGLFPQVVNVHRDALSRKSAGPHTVVDAHCTKCGDLMGWIFVEVDEDVEALVIPGEYLLIMPKLYILDVDDPPEPQGPQQGQEEDREQAAGPDQAQG